MKRFYQAILIVILLPFYSFAQQSQDGTIFRTYNPNEVSSSFQAYYFSKKQHFIYASFDQQYTSQRGLDGFMDKTFLDRLFRMQYSVYGNYCIDGKHWNIAFQEMLSQGLQGENGLTSRLLLTHLGSIRGVDFIKQVSTAYINNPAVSGAYYSYESDRPCYDVSAMVSIAKRFTIKNKERLRVSVSYCASCRGTVKKTDADTYNDRFIDLTSLQADISWRITDVVNIDLFAKRNTRYVFIAGNATDNGNYNIITPTYGLALRFFVIQEKMQKLNYIF